MNKTIKDYLDINYIEPPNGMSKDRFIEAISFHLPYAYEATKDEIKALELAIKVIKVIQHDDTGIEHND